MALTAIRWWGHNLVQASEAQARATEHSQRLDTLTDELRATAREVRELRREVGKALP